MGVVGAADPHRPRGGNFSAVVFATLGTGNHAAEGMLLRGLWLPIFLSSAVHFQLYQVIGANINDRLVGICCMVLGQLTVIHQSSFSQVIFTELGLK